MSDDNKNMESLKLLLVIPCYNEAGNIVSLLREIKGIGLNCDALVIDDGSTDNTYELASGLAPTVRMVENLGIGGAVQTGIKYARENNYDICMQIDGDGQHPPSQIHVLLDKYKESAANIIVASRFLSDGEFRSSFARRVGIRTINSVIKALFGVKITDSTSGMRLLDRQAIVIFSENYPSDFPEPISLAMAIKRGLSVREVPVHMKTRKHGSSSIIGFKTIAYILRVVGYIILVRLGG